MRSAAIGESAGSSDTYVLASANDRVDAFITYSLGWRPDPMPRATPLSGRSRRSPAWSWPEVTDGIIPAEESLAIFEDMNAPKYFVEIGEVGHVGFTDVCLIGADQGGLVGIIKAAGLDLPETSSAWPPTAAATSTWIPKLASTP